MKLGDNLKKLRESKGLTQQQMADLIHTHRTGYSKDELDKEEKTILIKLIETFVSKKRFKDYLQKNIAAL